MEFSSYIQTKEPNLKDSQLERISTDERYVQDNKIRETVNDILARVIIERPDEPKKFIVEELQKLKAKKGNPDLFFDNKDFEVMFDNYNILRKGSIPYPYLLQAMSLVGIQDPVEKLKQRYKDISEKTAITKEKFLEVMSKEYKSSH